jgi:FkbM family methyltransferase
MGKFSTGLKYASLGLGLGVDMRSRWVLASMLPRLKMHRALSLSNSNIYTATVQLEQLRRTVHFRDQDIFIFREVLVDNVYLEPDLYKEPPRCILDLGAHIGLATLRFAAAFPKATIHSYEPDPENFRLLNLSVEGLPNIVLHQEALGTTIGKATLYVNPDKHTATSLKANGNHGPKVVCSVTALDVAIRQAGAAVDLIKFDIEGVEQEVFSGSELAHQVKHIVGEMKASPAEIDVFLRLFPDHKAEIRQAAKNMYMIHLHKRSEEPWER